MMDEIQKRLLLEVADLHEVPEGAYNIRANRPTTSARTASPPAAAPLRILRSLQNRM